MSGSNAEVARETASQPFAGSLYFSYTGATVAAVLFVTVTGGLAKHSWDEVLLRAVIVVLATTAVYGAMALPREMRSSAWLAKALQHRAIEGIEARARRFGRYSAGAMAALFVLTAVVLAFDAHRRYTILLGSFEACAIIALRQPMSWRARLGMCALGGTTWSVSSGLTYTNLGDWILNSNASPFAICAFVISFGLVLLEFCDDRIEHGTLARSQAVRFGVLFIFVAFSLRSDNLLNTWVPYHRSFVADVAQLVREGHWVLWDVPSVYGFLATVAVAAVPSKDAWQGLFVLTSVILIIQSCIIFMLWRWGRSGSVNLVFATLIAVATFGDNIARYPWSARLYPQGSLRFVLILGLLLSAFLIYVWRDKRLRVEILYWVGHAIWLTSLFWSFEAAVWATVVWLPYLIIGTLADSHNSTGVIRRLTLRLLPPALLLLAAMLAVTLVFFIGLGHGPDWFSYVEFTGLFVAGSVHAAFPTNGSGAGWCILLVLGAVGAVGIAAIRQRLWSVTPLIAATWFAVWGTSTYFAVEPFDGHVALMLSVLIAATAILTYVSREIMGGDPTALYARLSLGPIAIICIAQFLGQASSFNTMTFPLSKGWTSDTLQELPPITGELSDLITRAGIKPGDGLLIPNLQFWTEISQGMLFPVAKATNGENVPYRAWAPLSPLGIEGTIMGLSKERRHTYIDRFLTRSHSLGWYVTYRTPAVCERISARLRTVRTLRSDNYSVSQCTFITSNKSPALTSPPDPL